MDRNCKTRHLRQALRDYKVENNGLLDYKDLSLLEDMSEYKVLKDRNGMRYRLVPPSSELTKQFFKRIRSFNYFMMDNHSKPPTVIPDSFSSIWELRTTQIQFLSWIAFDWQIGETIYHVQDVIIVPEFVNRFGFTSAYAYMINLFKQKYSITRRQHLELLYVTLTQTSQMQFVYVARAMLLAESYDKNANLFFVFRQICADHGLKFTGGPLPRFQAQPSKRLMDMDVDTFDLLLNGLEQGVHDLEEGLFINQSMKCVVGGVHQKKYNVKHVGEVAALSFPSLCVFTGLCRSENSITTAMFARLNDSPENSGSPNSYFNTMNNYIQQFVDPELGKYDRTYYDIASYAISKSWTEVQCTIENAFCARFRSTHKWEVYFKGFDLYTIFPASPTIKIKRFGQTTWDVMSFL